MSLSVCVCESVYVCVRARSRRYLSLAISTTWVGRQSPSGRGVASTDRVINVTLTRRLCSQDHDVM